MGGRRFGPDTIRFLQQDALFSALGDLALTADPLTSNRFALAGGNPVSFVEWDGHMLLRDGYGGSAPSPKRKPTQDEIDELLAEIFPTDDLLLDKDLLESSEHNQLGLPSTIGVCSDQGYEGNDQSILSSFGTRCNALLNAWVPTEAGLVSTAVPVELCIGICGEDDSISERLSYKLAQDYRFASAARTATRVGFRSFRAFKRVYGAAGEGYDWHHVVGQNPSNLRRFGPERIHTLDNIVRVPADVHRRISGFFESKPAGRVPSSG